MACKWYIYKYAVTHLHLKIRNRAKEKIEEEQVLTLWLSLSKFVYFLNKIIMKVYDNLGEPSKKKMGKVGLLDQPGGGSDRIPTFWQNFPKLNLPCNCP